MTDPLYAVSDQSTATLTIEDTTPLDLPRLSVFAGVDLPKEHPPTTGHFRIEREGSTNDALQVFYTLSGTAQNGMDFLQLPEVVGLPAGASNVLVEVLPVDDDLAEGNEFVVLSLSPSPDFSYNVLKSWDQLAIEDSPNATHRLAFGERFGGDIVLLVYGPLGRTCAIETSTNLLTWQPFATITIDFAPTSVSIPPMWQDTSRFYKSRLLPQ
jgi:hypothetical protein